MGADSFVPVLLALIAAAGSIGTAYVAVVAKQTQNTVNGRTEELLARVQLLEELLAWTKQQPADPPLPGHEITRRPD
jgi:hypothetical protein